MEKIKVAPKPEIKRDEKGVYKQCLQCGKKLYKKDSRNPGAWYRKKFCSVYCKNKYHTSLHTKKEVSEVDRLKELEKLSKSSKIKYTKVVSLPKKYQISGYPFSNFKRAFYFVTPQVNLEENSTKLHIRINVLVRGYWASAGVFNIEEYQLIKLLRAMKEYKEKVKNAKGKIKINERGFILEV